MTGSEPPIVGALVTIPEDGYKFGTGELVLRVTAMGPVSGQGWVRLTGHEIGWQGQRIGVRTVEALLAAVKLVRHPA